MNASVNEQHWLETYKSLITLSIEGFKFSALTNGGAAVALLAYLGNVTGKCFHAPDMRISMAAFLIGLTSCGAAMVFSYLTQLRILEEGRQDQTSAIVRHTWFLWAAMVCFFASLCAFGVGSWQAVVRFH